MADGTILAVLCSPLATGKNPLLPLQSQLGTMPQMRRSARRKRLKASSAAIDLERCSTREKKRRETLSPHESRSLPSAKKMLQALPSVVSGIWSDECDVLLDAISHLRRLLSIEHEPPIDEVLQSGALPYLLDFLNRDDCPQLQRQSACILKNICAGTSEHVKVVVDYGAIPIFAKLLESSSNHVLEQAIWALGNIAGDSSGCRDLFLSIGALDLLLVHLNEHSILSMLRIGTWALSNFCEGKPEPPLDQLESVAAVLSSLILVKDEEILTESCWALSYICCGNPAIIEDSMCQQIVKLTIHLRQFFKGQIHKLSMPFGVKHMMPSVVFYRVRRRRTIPLLRKRLVALFVYCIFDLMRCLLHLSRLVLLNDVLIGLD